MSVSVEVSYVDVKGKVKRGKYTAADATDAQSLLPLLKALTNARISYAAYTTPLDVSAISSNTAANADASAAEAQLSVVLTGPALTGGTRREKVTFQIPAYKAALVTTDDKLDITNSDVGALLGVMTSSHGGTLDRVDGGRVL